MGKFQTLDLAVIGSAKGNYKVEVGPVLDSVLQINTEVIGQWRPRPKGRRLFTPEQIRVIRSNAANGFTHKEQAVAFGCSHVSIYHIVNRSIYKDVA